MSASNPAQNPFVIDTLGIRKRARAHMEEGPVTDGYKVERETIIKLLNDALATEIVCVLRYRRHYFMAAGIHAEPVAAHFLEHSIEEQAHADLLARRIAQLGGEPDLNPEGLLTKSATEYVEGRSLIDMIREDLVAERIAIDTYGEIVRYVGNTDPTTRRVLEEILAKEEEHADELRDLLQTLDPTKPI